MSGIANEILEAFAAESAENLESVADSIASLEEGKEGAIDELFRAVHTLKGSASIVGFSHLEFFAHDFESRLSSLRSGAAILGPDAPGALLACRDNLASILVAASQGQASSSSPAKLTQGEAAALLALDRALNLAPLLSPESASDLAQIAASSASSASAVSETRTAPAKASSGAYSRVANRKLDAMLEESSELTQALSEFGGHLRAAGLADLTEELVSLHAFASQHYRTILEARTEPFGAVAEPYRRAVAEIGRESGKEIEFEVRGAETEIDRALADRLSEPLLHLVRNAADHGIEEPEARLAVGKNRAGKIALSVRRESSCLVVRVEDDGRGIDPEAVRARAAEADIPLASGAAASEEELLALLTRPGFSLSRKVTKWSGRGVGLDAVEKSLRQARGSLRLESRKGDYFAAEIRLPLALSLVEGFTARAGDYSLLVPFDAVSSCETFEDAELSGSIYRTVALSGQLLPAVDLSFLYGGKATAKRVAIIVQSAAALLVDEVGEALSAAVRPLESRFGDSPGLAGIAAIGDGSLVLALDVTELLRMALRRGQHP
jgi:two-component system chemotaxis sensor kinase CheA